MLYGMMLNLTKKCESVLKMSVRFGVIQKMFKSLKTQLIKYGIIIASQCNLSFLVVFYSINNNTNDTLFNQ